MSRFRPLPPSLALVLFAPLCACGPPEPAAPPLPLGKVPPTLPRQVRQRTLAEWLVEAQAPEEVRRVAALFALPELVAEPGGALARLIAQALEERSPDLRYAALVAAARLTADPGLAVARGVARQLDAPEAGLRKTAAATLAALAGLSTATVLSGVREAWFPPGAPRPALSVLRAVGALGAGAGELAPALVAHLEPADDGQQGVVDALERVGAPALGALLEGLAGQADEAATLRLSIASRAGPALAPFVEALGRAAERPGLRRGALEALHEAGAAALPVLDRLAGAADAALAAAAAATAEQLRAP